MSYTVTPREGFYANDSIEIFLGEGSGWRYVEIPWVDLKPEGTLDFLNLGNMTVLHSKPVSAVISSDVQHDPNYQLPFYTPNLGVPNTSDLFVEILGDTRSLKVFGELPDDYFVGDYSIWIDVEYRFVIGNELFPEDAPVVQYSTERIEVIIEDNDLKSSPEIEEARAYWYEVAQVPISLLDDVRKLTDTVTEMQRAVSIGNVRYFSQLAETLENALHLSVVKNANKYLSDFLISKNFVASGGVLLFFDKVSSAAVESFTGAIEELADSGDLTPEEVELIRSDIRDNNLPDLLREVSARIYQGTFEGGQIAELRMVPLVLAIDTLADINSKVWALGSFLYSIWTETEVDRLYYMLENAKSELVRVQDELLSFDESVIQALNFFQYYNELHDINFDAASLLDDFRMSSPLSGDGKFQSAFGDVDQLWDSAWENDSTDAFDDPEEDTDTSGEDQEDAEENENPPDTTDQLPDVPVGLETTLISALGNAFYFPAFGQWLLAEVAGDPVHFLGTSNRDIIGGSGSHDYVSAGLGDDDLQGNRGNDTMFGQEGDDFIRGGVGRDSLSGGDGEDVVRGQKHGDLLFGGNGADNVKGGGGNDKLFGGDGGDFLKGGSRVDIIHGGEGRDKLFGNSFGDQLYGGSGDDTLNAGGGDDTIRGGAGNDVLKGGEGSDVFIFGTGLGFDRIVDFGVGEDVLRLSSALVGGQDVAQIRMNAEFGNGDMLFDFGGDMILLVGVGADEIDAVTIEIS